MGQEITFQLFDFTDERNLRATGKLQDDLVHVWQRRLAADPISLECGNPVLSDEEHERASRFQVQNARDAFVLTRSALRVLLGAYLGQSPQSVQFQVTKYGKPFLDPAHALHFNVSHTDGLALLAFAQKRRVGIDVEKIRPQPDALKLAHRFFSAKEWKQLENLRAEELTAGFFRCWSRKEAYIKARGEGLSLPLSQFDVAVEARPGQILLETRPDAAEARQWLLRDVPMGSGYAAAVAVSALESQLP